MVRRNKIQAGTEKRLRRAIITGDPLDLRSKDEDANNVSRGGEWGAERTVNAEVLNELLTRPDGSRKALLLAGARITGSLDLSASETNRPIRLWDCWFEETILLSQASLLELSLIDCHLPALNAEQLVTRGDLDLRGSTVTGEVSVLVATINGNLNLGGATLTNSGGAALVADGLVVGQNLYLDNGFTADGEVRMISARVGTQLICRGATLKNANGYALQAARLTVEEDMLCWQGFNAQSEVRLPGAHIKGRLDFSRATLTSTGRALFLAELRAGTLILRGLTEPPGWVDLHYAQIGVLHDDQATWPEKISLQGLTYDTLFEQPEVKAAQRLDWLKRDPEGYSPQPYEQLVAVYRRAGREEDARIVAIAKQRARRRTLSLPGKVWSLLLDGLVGYGYRTWWAILWLVAFVLAGWWLFDRAHDAQLLIAAKPPGQRPWFYAAVYALDLLLPFADLGYQGSWIADGWARPWYLVWTLVGALLHLL